MNLKPLTDFWINRSVILSVTVGQKSVFRTNCRFHSRIYYKPSISKNILWEFHGCWFDSTLNEPLKWSFFKFKLSFLSKNEGEYLEKLSEYSISRKFGKQYLWKSKSSPIFMILTQKWGLTFILGLKIKLGLEWPLDK